MNGLSGGTFVLGRSRTSPFYFFSREELQVPGDVHRAAPWQRTARPVPGRFEEAGIPRSGRALGGLSRRLGGLVDRTDHETGLRLVAARGHRDRAREQDERGRRRCDPLEPVEVGDPAEHRRESTSCVAPVDAADGGS
jgi:hypothetical protein